MKERLQEAEGWCGPGVLQWVAKQEGLSFTQSELAEVMNTSVKDGTSHEQMVEGLKYIGLKGFPLEGLRIGELGILLKDYHVIVNWMSGPNDADDGHYALIDKVENGIVYLNDATIPIPDFEKNWYDIEDGKRVNRWALVVYKR